MYKPIRYPHAYIKHNINKAIQFIDFQIKWLPVSASPWSGYIYNVFPDSYVKTEILE